MADVITFKPAFSNGFSLGFQQGLQPVVISATVGDVTVTTSLPDFLGCDSVIKRNSVFDKSSKCYETEKELYSISEMCMWNNFGVKCEYYFVDYNTSYDQTFGEDGDRTVTRSFALTASLELPKEEEFASRFGLEGLDVFEVFTNKYHFAHASTYSADTSGVYPTDVPKEGDIIRTKYNDKFYEVLSVKDTTDQFLQAQHTWKMIVRENKDLHFNVSATTEVDKISAVTDQEDLFDISSAIDIEKEDYIITSAMDLTAGRPLSDDPFGNW